MKSIIFVFVALIGTSAHADSHLMEIICRSRNAELSLKWLGPNLEPMTYHEGFLRFVDRGGKARVVQFDYPYTIFRPLPTINGAYLKLPPYRALTYRAVIEELHSQTPIFRVQLFENATPVDIATAGCI